MAEADIKLLIGAKGGASPSGSSAMQIRQELQSALSGKNGIKVSVRLFSNAASNLRQEIQKSLDSGTPIKVKIQSEIAKSVSSNVTSQKINIDSSSAQTDASKELGRLLTDLNAIEKRINSTKIKLTTMNSDSVNFKEMNDLLSAQCAEWDKINAKITEISSKNPGLLEGLRQQSQYTLDNAQRTIDLQSAWDKVATSEENARRKQEQYSQSLQQSNMDWLNKQIASANNIQAKYTGTTSTSAVTDESNLNRLNTLYNDITQKIYRLQQLNGQWTSEQAASLEKDIARLREMSNELLVAEKNQQKLSNSMATAAQEKAKFNRYLTTINPQGLTESADAIKKIQDDFDKMDFTSARNGIKELRAHFIEMGYEGGNVFTYLYQKIKTFSTYLMSSAITMMFVKSFREAKQAVIDINSALTQLKIVTGATSSQMKAFFSNSAELAKKLGQSITDVLGSIETFSRLGYNLPDASKLAEFAGILSNVANVDTSSATTGMTAIIKGFNMDVSNAEHVADVLVQVGQKYAVSASELMEAFERSGAALNASNTSFEKSAALIAAANAAVEFCRVA